jgi:uncharacterized protein
MLTRRAALTIAATAPAWGQSRPGAKMANPVVFFEIGCKDRAKTERFFSDLFGWNINSAGPASTIDTGSPKGIQGHINSLGHEPHHYAMFYVEVDDIKAYLDKAVALGGKTLVPPIKIPTGTFAWFADIEGNTIGLIQPNK